VRRTPTKPPLIPDLPKNTAALVTTATTAVTGRWCRCRRWTGCDRVGARKRPWKSKSRLISQSSITIKSIEKKARSVDIDAIRRNIKQAQQGKSSPSAKGKKESDDATTNIQEDPGQARHASDSHKETAMAVAEDILDPSQVAGSVGNVP
jgi:hypothetical protein